MTDHGGAVTGSGQTARPQSDWRQAAACRDLDPGLFFPVETTGPAASQAAQAKRVCLACPVRVPCLNWAIGHYQGHGACAA